MNSPDLLFSNQRAHTVDECVLWEDLCIYRVNPSDTYIVYNRYRIYVHPFTFCLATSEPMRSTSVSLGKEGGFNLVFACMYVNA